ncbi:GTP-binding protein [Kitasatospora sp. NPDC094028]
MRPDPNRPAQAIVKIVIAGGFGAGKTTLVRTLSEIPPLTTEAYLTAAGQGTDDITGLAHKKTTTVAMDYGRITLAEPAVEVHLFGTPGQPRFSNLWEDLVRGALGAVVLADTRRLVDSFTSIDFFEQRGTPFVIAVNEFDHAARYTPSEVSDALDLDPGIPVLLCDARDRRSAARALPTVVGHALNRAQSALSSMGVPAT